jgi:hypothetical protein
LKSLNRKAQIVFLKYKNNGTMEQHIELNHNQKQAVKMVYLNRQNSLKSIFDIDVLVDEIFDVCMMNAQEFDLSEDNEDGDLANLYYNLIYDYLEYISEEIAA